MSESFLGEIKIISWNFPPKGWTFCNGQLLPINQNQGLFSLLGTTYGGDGRQTFGLPNLQGRVSLGSGNHVLGERGGETSHTLNISELPAHGHGLSANSGAANVSRPGSNVLAKAEAANYESAATPVTMGSSNSGHLVVGNTGGSQPHENMQPYLVLNFCIALQGIFPSQT
ncbi:phage tail protein [Dokdonella soli]|uniref:Tail fiber protein n=1 Tax=Dokdonella soli TaxID=529810 RepID=A0ABN1IMD6_9GAMM